MEEEPELIHPNCMGAVARVGNMVMTGAGAD